MNLLNAYAWIGLLPGALKAYLWKDHPSCPAFCAGRLPAALDWDNLYFLPVHGNEIHYLYLSHLDAAQYFYGLFILSKKEKPSPLKASLGEPPFYGALAAAAYHLPKLAPGLLSHPKDIFLLCQHLLRLLLSFPSTASEVNLYGK